MFRLRGRHGRQRHRHLPIPGLQSRAGRRIPPDAWRTQATQQAYAAFDQLYRNWAAGIASPDQIDQAREQWRSIVRTTLNDLGDSLLAQAPPSAFTGRYDASGTLQSAGKADLFFRSAVNKLTATPSISSEQDNPPQDNA